MSPAARGTFIVIEGLDRSGKSTQVPRLVDRIQSVTTDASTSGSPLVAVPLKFPGQSPLLLLPRPWTGMLTLFHYSTSSLPHNHDANPGSRWLYRDRMSTRLHHESQLRNGAHNAIRPNDGDRQDDRRVFALRIRARRPCHSPPLLRQ
jgi:hypothetical protein